MTTPSNSSAMNFDFPPASRPSTSGSRGARHLLHQRIREFNTIRAQHESLSPSDGHQSPRRASFQDQTPAPPPTIGRHARPFNRRHRGGPAADPPTSILMDRLHNVTSEADSLLEQPIPRIGSPDVATREYMGEAEVNKQRKRRKIDHEGRPLGVGMNGFRYGHRGSVAPGPLRMEIVSCDGGVLPTDATRTGRDYVPENVLRNDRSVYCTNTNKCNIIFRHRDETTFTLSKIVIKAPETGFTAPVQEGLIFVTMTADGLLSRTAPYKIRETSPPPRTIILRGEDAQRPPSRRRDSTSRSVPPPISHIGPMPPTPSEHSPYGNVIASEQRNSSSSSPSTTMTSTTTTITTPPPQIQGFELSTHCDTPSSDEEEPSTAATLADRQRRDQAPPPYADHSSDSEDIEEGIERVLEARALGISPRMLRGDMRSGRRGRRRLEPSKIECRIPNMDLKPPMSATSTPDGGAAAGASSEDQRQKHEQQLRSPNILPPHARFFIEREKSVVSVKFEPAVTGKFILLKLWSPSLDQNIDIQSIVVHGFAGPRFFPGTKVL